MMIETIINFSVSESANVTQEGRTWHRGFIEWSDIVAYYMYHSTSLVSGTYIRERPSPIYALIPQI